MYKARLYAVSNFVANTAALLVAMRLMSAYSGDTLFTDYLLCTNIFGILLVLDFGFQQSSVKEIREYSTQGSGVSPLQTVQNYWFIAIWLSLLFCMLALAVLLFSFDLSPQIIFVAFCVIIQYVSIYLGALSGSMLKALDEFRFVFFVNLICSVATIFFAIILVVGFSVDIGVPLVLACTQLVSIFILKKKLAQLLNVDLKFFYIQSCWKDMTGVLRRARSFSMNSLAVIATNQGQRLLMAELLGVVQSGALTSMMNVVGKVHQICAMYSEILFHRAIETKRNSLLSLYIRETSAIIIISLLPLVALMLFGDVIYFYLMGQAVGAVAVEINPYVCVIVFVMCISCPASYLLNAIGEVRVNTWYSIANSIFFLIALSVFFASMLESVIVYLQVLAYVYVANAFVYHFVVLRKLRFAI